MNYAVIVHPGAVAEIEAAHAYLAEWSEQAADHWYEALKKEVAGLCSMPRRFPVAAESRHVGREVRQVVVGKYRVLFTVDGEAVHVLHVRHAALPPLTPEEGI